MNLCETILLKPAGVVRAVEAHNLLAIAMRDQGNTGTARGAARRIEIAMECHSKLGLLEQVVQANQANDKAKLLA